MVVERNYWCLAKNTHLTDIDGYLNFEEKQKQKHREDWKKEGERRGEENHNMLIGIENIAAELKAIM